MLDLALLHEPPQRILFRASNRRGLGHMMRGLNIAREILALEPAADILFCLHSAPAAGFWNDDFRYVLDPGAPGHWAAILADFAPAVVVYDTLLPQDAAAEPLAADARYVYIMRKCRREQQQEVFRNGFLARADAILIPHTEDEFGYALPAALRAKAHFVGPIVRQPDAQGQKRLRAKYRLRPEDFLLTSTAGGGGFTQSAESFFATVCAAHRLLAPRVPNLRHLAIAGPNYAGALAPGEGLSVIDCEPDMVNLLALSDLVIAEGGYNTVNEIRVCKTPAIFLPAPRGKDDQEERVRALEARGLALVFAQGAADAIAAELIRLIRSNSALEEMRERYGREQVELGNRSAAQHIVKLAHAYASA